MRPTVDSDVVDYADEYIFAVEVNGDLGEADLNIGGRVVCVP